MLSVYLYGRLTRLGLAVAIVAGLLDQTIKLWLLFVFDLESKQQASGRVRLAPFIDLVLVWNRGVSYGLFQQDSVLGQRILLAIKLLAMMLLWGWLARADSKLVAVSLGLIIGGAIGNAVDQIAYGAVADFVLFHITTATFNFDWYVFNLADSAIVAGVIGLMYDSLFRPRAAKAPRSAS
jgi:signal peptidase II